MTIFYAFLEFSNKLKSQNESKDTFFGEKVIFPQKNDSIWRDFLCDFDILAVFRVSVLILKINQYFDPQKGDYWAKTAWISLTYTTSIAYV
jgi:hypothetical protein